MFVRELVLSYRQRPGSKTRRAQRQVLNADEAAAVLRPILEDEAVETFGVLCLSQRGHVLGYHEVSRGDLSATVVHPRAIFQAAMLANTATVVVAHNHPSGDPAPSADDLAITRRLEAAGRLLGIPVQDHIIIGHDKRFCSLRQAGYIERETP